jgi:hypothetical protein
VIRESCHRRPSKINSHMRLELILPQFLIDEFQLESLHFLFVQPEIHTITIFVRDYFVRYTIVVCLELRLFEEETEWWSFGNVYTFWAWSQRLPSGYGPQLEYHSNCERVKRLLEGVEQQLVWKDTGPTERLGNQGCRRIRPAREHRQRQHLSLITLASMSFQRSQTITHDLVQHETLPVYLYRHPFDIANDFRVSHVDTDHVSLD